jgi:hypothetical protein
MKIKEGATGERLSGRMFFGGWRMEAKAARW